MATVNKSGIVDGAILTAEKVTRIIDAVETYSLKHIPITGISGSPDLITIKPGIAGANHVFINGVEYDGVTAQGYFGNKAVPIFETAANYYAMKYHVHIMSEQEEQVMMVFSISSPKINTNGEIELYLYRNGIGSGYNGGSGCYCSITISRI